MLDYGPHTANEHTDAVTAKLYGPRILQQHYVQQVRPNLTNPYLVAETAQRIFLEAIKEQGQEPVSANEPREDWAANVAKASMEIAKALHAEFKKYEDEVEGEAMAGAMRDVQKNKEHNKFMTELLDPKGPAIPMINTNANLT